jgi:hypothetical protein
MHASGEELRLTLSSSSRSRSSRVLSSVMRVLPLMSLTPPDLWQRHKHYVPTTHKVDLQLIIQLVLDGHLDLSSRDLLVLLSGVRDSGLDEGLILRPGEDGHVRLEEGEEALDDDRGEELAVAGLIL